MQFVADCAAPPPPPAIAGSADLSGTLSYQVTGSGNGDSVRIEIGRITNNSRTTTTGTLHVTLRFTTGSSPFGTGYNVARESLSFAEDNGTLAPGESYANIRFTTDYRPPPAGTYYVHILVSQYPDLNTTLDTSTFTRRETIERGSGNSNTGGGASGGFIDLSGSLSYQVLGDSVRIEIGRIINNSRTTTTGTLFVTLHYSTGSSPSGIGYRTARQSLSFAANNGTLAPGAGYSNIRFTTDYRPPPAGTYYVHLYVSQHPNHSTILDSHTFTRRVTFGGSGSGSGSGNSNNVRDGASALQLNDVVSAVISPANDVDYWQFTLTESGVVTLETSGSTDTVGRLEDARGGLLAEDDDSGTNLNFQIQETLPAGTYYIRVAGYGGRTGNYRLSLDFEPDATGGSGSGGGNNTRGGASALQPNDVVSAAISPANDVDYWQFTLTESGVVTLETSGSTDTVGRLEDARGVALTGDDDSGTRQNFRIQETLPAGTYYIRATGYRGSTGNYTLSLDFEPDATGGGGSGSGNDVNTACFSSDICVILPLNSSVRGTISQPADIDVWGFTLTEPGTVTLETSGSLNTSGQLRDNIDEFFPLASDVDSGVGQNFRIQETLPAGTYLIIVSSFARYGGGGGHR